MFCFLVAALLALAASSAVPVCKLEELPPIPELATHETSAPLDISSVLNVVTPTERLLLHVEESYSSSQRRSKISYLVNLKKSGLDLPDEGTLYINNEENKVYLHDTVARTCSIVNSQRVLEFFQLDKIEAGNGAPLGPARLLFFLRANRNKFELLQPSIVKSERNLPIRRYLLRPVQSGTCVQAIQADYYVHSAEAAAAIPMRLVFQLDGVILEVDFLSQANDETRQATKFLAATHLNSLQSFSSSNAQFDKLAIPPSIGCAAIEPSNGADGSRSYVALFSPTGDEPTRGRRFSFNCHVHSTLYGKVHAFVAYDVALRSMRVEKVRKNSHSFTVTNFNSAEFYSIFKLLKIDPNSKLESALGDTSCSRMDLPTSSEFELSPGAPEHLSQVLFGSTKFLYLGRAQVRGIWTDAYEASEGVSPHWLSQHVIPHKVGVDKREFSRTTLVYLASQVEHCKSGDKCSRNVQVPVEMEISVRIKRRNSFELHNQVRVSLFDFSWQLDAVSPLGTSPNNYFSVAEECTGEPVAREVGLVKLSLAAYKSQQQADNTVASLPDWLRVPSKRNHAILVNLQFALKLPPTHIFELESDLSTSLSPKLQQEVGGAAIPVAALRVSFKQFASVKTKTKFVYFGTCSTQSSFSKHFVKTMSPFSSCAILAACLKHDTFFAYDFEAQICYIDTLPGAVVRVGKSTIEPRAFSIGKGGRLQLYFVSNEADTSLDVPEADPVAQLKRKGRIEAVSLAKFQLVDPVWGEKQQAGPVEFVLQSISQELKDGHKQKHKLLGLGLVLDEGESEFENAIRIEPEMLAQSFDGPKEAGQEDNKSEMTIGQCHAACLADFDCKSFSFCFQNSRLECVLSRKLSFESRETVEKLEKVLGEKKVDLKRADLVALTGSGVSLRKSANCELNAKIYLDLFHEAEQTTATFTRRIVYKVGVAGDESGREQCARMCFQRTLDRLNLGSKNVPTKLSLDDDDAAAASDSFKEAVDRYKLTMNDMCYSFLYVDAATLADSRGDSVASIKLSRQAEDADGEKSNELPEGYCLLGERAGAQERQQLRQRRRSSQQNATESANSQESFGSVSQYLRFDKFAFKFELMFEKQFGVSLRNSGKSEEELEAYYALVRNLPGSRSSPSPVETMRKFVARGDNSQEFIGSAGDERKCALVCSRQSFGPWPACKSFDLTVYRNGDETFVKCTFNSISLRQAMLMDRRDLIESSGAKQDSARLQVWHFEPRPGFVLAEAEAAGALVVAQADQIASQQLAAQAGEIMGPFLSTCMALVALLAGLLLGMQIGSRVGQTLPKCNQVVQQSCPDDCELIAKTEE